MIFFPWPQDCVLVFRNCWVLSTSFINLCNNQSPQKFDRTGEHAGWSRSLFYIFCSSKNFFFINALWIAAYLAENTFLLLIDYTLFIRDKSFSIFTKSAAFCWPQKNYSLSFPEDENSTFPDHKISSPTMPCWVILLWNFFACQYVWKPSGPSKLNLFSSKETPFLPFFSTHGLI